LGSAGREISWQETIGTRRLDGPAVIGTSQPHRAHGILISPRTALRLRRNWKAQCLNASSAETVPQIAKPGQASPRRWPSQTANGNCVYGAAWVSEKWHEIADIAVGRWPDIADSPAPALTLCSIQLASQHSWHGLTFPSLFASASASAGERSAGTGGCSGASAALAILRPKRIVGWEGCAADWTAGWGVLTTEGTITRIGQQKNLPTCLEIWPAFIDVAGPAREP